MPDIALLTLICVLTYSFEIVLSRFRITSPRRPWRTVKLLSEPPAAERLVKVVKTDSVE